MIRRRWMRWGAVGAAAAVALTGCAGDDEPAPPSTPSSEVLDNEELATLTQTVFQSFLDEESAMYEEFDYDFTRLTDYVTDEVATRAVADMEGTHELGINFRGNRIAAAALVATPQRGDSAEVDVCIDGRNSEAYDIESGAVWEATSSQVNPWRLTVTISGRGDVLIAEQNQIDPDASAVCSSVS